MFYFLPIGLLLAGCGSQITPTVTAAPSSGAFKAAFTGLEVMGQPNIAKRHIILPQQTTLGLKPSGSFRTQSVLPAWTGPRVFVTGIDNNNYNSWKFDINSKGEFFAQNWPIRSNKSLPLEISKYNSTGQVLSTQKSLSTGSGYDPRLPQASHWLAVTEDSPEEETYQLFGSSSNEYYGNITKDYEQVLAEVYSTSLVPLRNTTDPIYPVFFLQSSDGANRS